MTLANGKWESRRENENSGYFRLKQLLINPEFEYTLSEAWRGVNWADLMAAQGAFGTDFKTGLYSDQSIVPTIVLVDLS